MKNTIHNLFLFLIVLLVSCQSQSSKDSDQTALNMQTQKFFIGTYTNGNSKGIYQMEMDKEGKLTHKGLMVAAENPSYLAKSPDNKFLLCVNEIDNEANTGLVTSYQILDKSLYKMNAAPTGGAHPCYIDINNDGQILTANYTGGNIGLLQLKEKGEISDLIQVTQHAGKGPHERQDGPHAHCIRFSNFNTDIFAIDLGTNALIVYQLSDNKKSLLRKQEIQLDSAAGPRHIEFHPSGNWLYVINELNSSITKITNSNGRYKAEESVSTLPASFDTDNLCADIHISDDGNFLYASNRGHNSIAIFAVSQKSGKLRLVGHQTVRGDWPRNFALSPDQNFLLVANQKSNNIVVFSRNVLNGKLSYVDALGVDEPVCILF